MPFEKGQSGNPAGRPPGSRSKAIQALETLAAGRVEAIAKAVLTSAEGGDVPSARLILERLWPSRKGTPITFDLPALETEADLPKAIASITAQVAAGEISPDEGVLVVSLIEAQRKAIETGNHAARLAALEEGLKRQ